MDYMKNFFHVMKSYFHVMKSEELSSSFHIFAYQKLGWILQLMATLV